MNPVEDQAKLAYEDYYGVGAIDPILILAIISTIIQIIRFLKTCKKDQDKAIQIIQSPGFFQKWQFKRILRKAMVEYEIPQDKYKELYDILWKKKDKITISEFGAMWNSV